MRLLMMTCLYLNPFHWLHQAAEWRAFDWARRHEVADCRWAASDRATETGCLEYRRQADACKGDG